MTELIGPNSARTFGAYTVGTNVGCHFIRWNRRPNSSAYAPRSPPDGRCFAGREVESETVLVEVRRGRGANRMSTSAAAPRFIWCSRDNHASREHPLNDCPHIAKRASGISPLIGGKPFCHVVYRQSFVQHQYDVCCENGPNEVEASATGRVANSPKGLAANSYAVCQTESVVAMNVRPASRRHTSRRSRDPRSRPR